MPTDPQHADAARTPPTPALAAEIVIDLFRRAGRALRASDFDAPGEWAAALTMPQLRVLYLLGRQGSLPVGSVAEAMRISQPSATETIDRLVRAGAQRILQRHHQMSAAQRILVHRSRIGEGRQTDLHDAGARQPVVAQRPDRRSEEHTSELQSH